MRSRKKPRYRAVLRDGVPVIEKNYGGWWGWGHHTIGEPGPRGEAAIKDLCRRLNVIDGYGEVVPL